MFSLLHNNIKLIRCDIADFGMFILSTAKSCSNILKASNKGEIELTKSQKKKIKSQVVELWSIFPLICLSGPSDISTSFPKLVPIINAALVDETYPELKFSIVNGLSYLANHLHEKYPTNNSDCSKFPDYAVLEEFSGTFIPQILDLIENLELSKTQNCLNCIAAWGFIIKKSFLSAISKKILQNLLLSTGNLENDEVNAKAAAWVSILLALLPYLTPQIITLFYKTIRPLLVVGESISLQKRAYVFNFLFFNFLFFTFNFFN